MCASTHVGVCSHMHTLLGSLTWEEVEIGLQGEGQVPPMCSECL